MGMTTKEYHEGYQQGFKDAKADYENRLKADMVAMLTDIQLEIEETPNPISTRITGCSKDGWFLGMAQAKGIIQHKINALRGGEDGNDD